MQAMWPPYEVPAKNTFVDFPVADADARQARAQSCPPALGRVETQDTLWALANQELCHCMGVKIPCVLKKPAQAPVAAQAPPAAPGARSWVSVVKTSGEETCEPGAGAVATLAAPAPPAAPGARSWVSVVKTSDKAKCELDTGAAAPVAAQAPPAAPGARSWVDVVKASGKGKYELGAGAPFAAQAPPAALGPRSWASVVKTSDTGTYELSAGAAAPKTPATPASAAASRADRLRLADAAVMGTSARSGSSAVDATGKGCGKGLPNFERIRVGIEDDSDFCVVRRLIGPGGEHVKDIVASCPGAKVWITGRGSRSWEDSQCPLTICVGAPKTCSFEKAIRLVSDLLQRVRQEHADFRGRLAA